MPQVSKIVFAIVFLGQVISSHHSDQMSQRSQVSMIPVVIAIAKIVQNGRKKIKTGQKN